MSTPNENWRPIVGWEGVYQVSSFGGVRNARTLRLLKPQIDKDGYHYLALKKGPKVQRRAIHHLVLEAFTGLRPSSDFHCRHLNGRRADNRPANLAWGTVVENHADIDLHGTRARGLNNGGWSQAKLTDEDIRRIREAAFFGARKTNLAQIYGICRAQIYNILTGSWLHVS
jgi:hypothetical protein